ncbi:Leucine-, isoleucine-, valine-, threonine-, and alanine-binding protein [Fundidesulfovibrio magnetotacticus]|uniref:Leucine-, isoleucine-, valine-, threonine-, and alanine-binding protein n=1 Tax=Fundidesulfovibrio magnetotacticus TaxID=2730080 RepID=A0A6V8LP54_9BACT|nr:ABC transporter substrate-binding protein [Fundidesulfovibrio magnetotacticus]GFK93504.1 Leucine-, isoleucine-, valine-, threonine-, and alanine-binding protein [Fundidesulfovibrio magnetotacticus]
MAWRMLAALVLAVSAALPARAADTVKIGAVVSVTGPASYLGEPEKNTLLYLQDQLNEKGGIGGQKVEVIVYDDESDVNKAVLAAEKLLKRDQVAAVVGPSVSGNTLALMPKMAEAKVPLVSMAAAEKIVNPVNPWIFKTPQSDRLAVAKLLADAKAKGFKKLAIITVSDGFGQAGREVLKEMIPAAGMELVADEIFGPKDTDMTAQLTKIAGAAPQAVICWGTGPAPAQVARGRAQLGQKTPLYMSHGVASPKFVELAGEAAEGLVLPASWIIVADQMPEGPFKALLSAYIQGYTKRFGTAPSAFGGYGYDALTLLAEAARISGNATPQGLRDGLEKVKGLQSATGVFNFSEKDHNGLDESSFAMVRIEGGKFVLVK